MNNVYQKVTSAIIFILCIEIRFPISIQQIHSAIESLSVVLSSTSLIKPDSKGGNRKDNLQNLFCSCSTKKYYSVFHKFNNDSTEREIKINTRCFVSTIQDSQKSLLEV